MSTALSNPGNEPHRGLLADLTVTRGDYTLTARLAVDPGEVVAVVGPNGAGKSTLLRAVAGTVASSGEVRVDGTRWDQWPPHRRRIGLVHQDHSLFPHLTALGNVAYGPLSHGVRRAAARRTAQGLLDRLGVGELSVRRPSELSGGQSQRVAVARALATDPQVLLLDEPFAALDVAVAQRLREELHVMLADFDGVTLLVTHDPVDMFTLADRLVVIEDGRVAQTGAPADVAERPATAHAARLVGRNVLSGRAEETTVHLDDGQRLISVTPASGHVLATFAPSAVTVTLSEPTGSARNRWPSTVRHLVPTGQVVRVHLVVPDGPDLLGDLTPDAVRELDLAPGHRVWASVKATDVQVVGAGAAAEDGPAGSP